MICWQQYSRSGLPEGTSSGDNGGEYRFPPDRNRTSVHGHACTQTDGHAYIPAAIDKGAVAVLCEELPEELKAGITYIQVKDSEDAVGKVATTFYGDPTSKMELIGVTGTNGKTTVATLLYNTFRYFGYKVGLISTVCNYIDDEAIPTEHTTPDRSH